MKKIYLLAVLIILKVNIYAQNLDPLWDIWQYEHGATIESFVNNYGETNYYVTWSSSAGTPWTHDIYNKIVAFDVNGAIYTVKSDTKYIATWEAQEPISTAINPSNNYIFSIWEDGSDSNIPNEAVNVHAQIHKPDGSIIKSNFLLAGGADAQHSAVATHLSGKFVGIYCDDNVPGETAIYAKVYNDQNGNLLQQISITPDDEYHWWPAVAATDDGEDALVVWVHDTELVAGTIISNSGNQVSVASYQDYLSNTQFVNQQVNWLENISKFVIIAKTLNQNKSKICLVDRNGNKVLETEVNGAVLQEARPAIKWDASTQSYIYLYPTGVNDINVLQISDNNVRFDHKIIGNQDPELSWLQWKKTGTWSTFVVDDTGKDKWNGKYIALFAWGDYDTDEELMATVYIDTDVFAQNGTSETVLSYDDFENGWGNFSDGGSDCSMYSGSSYAHQGSKAVQIRDDSGDQSSFEHTNGIDVTAYDKLKVEFWFKAKSMENGEDFWVMYWDGYTWNDIGIYAKGTDFVNGKYYFKSILLDRNDVDFVNNMKIRFQCDASGNYDFVYIDEVKVVGIIGGNGLKSTSVSNTSLSKKTQLQKPELPVAQEPQIKVFPNPVTNGTLNLKTEGFTGQVQVRIFNLQGSMVLHKRVEAQSIINLSDVSGLSKGVYLLNLADKEKSVSTRFLVK